MFVHGHPCVWMSPRPRQTYFPSSSRANNADPVVDIPASYCSSDISPLDLDILSPFNIVYTLYSCDFDFCYKLCVFKTLSKSLKRSKQRTSFLPALHVQSKNFPYFTNNLWCMDGSRTIWHPDNLAPDSFSL